MKVLVTGATGFVGSHAARSILAAGHSVRLLVRDEARARSFLSDIAGREDVEFIVGDVCDADGVSTALDDCESVVHAAAMVALHRAQAAEAHRVNTTAAATVLGQAARRGLDPIVHISSVSVLQPTPPVTGVDAPLRQGAGGYSASKVDCEWMCRGMQAAGVPVVIVYPSGVVGPNAPAVTPTHSALVSSVKSMPATSSGLNAIDVRDLGDMIAAALVPGRGPQRVMAGGRFYEWGPFLDTVDRLRGKKVFRYPAPGAALRAVGKFVDVTRLSLPVDFELSHETMVEATLACPYDSAASEEFTGITPRPLEETLTDTYRWLHEFGALTRAEIGNIANLAP